MEQLKESIGKISQLEKRKKIYIIRILFDDIYRLHKSGFTIEEIYKTFSEAGYEGKLQTFKDGFTKVKKEQSQSNKKEENTKVDEPLLSKKEENSESIFKQL